MISILSDMTCTMLDGWMKELYTLHKYAANSIGS